MKRFLVAAVLLCAIGSSPVHSKQKKHHVLAPECNVSMPCEGGYYSARAKKFLGVPFGMPLQHYRPERPKQQIVPVKRGGGLVAPLAAKASEIEQACGSKIISAVRYTNIAGTRIRSLHATGQAVDMQGNPSCIYAHLQGWQGGYTTDYSRVRHVHISWGGREHGIRFAHGGGRKKKTRYAASHQ